MPTLAHFGAGAIGRALVGTLFSDAGWRTVFLDAAPVVVEALRERGAYSVRVLEPDSPDAVRHVNNVTGISAHDRDAVVDALAGADLWGSSVGAGVLPKLFPTLADALVARRARGGGPVSMLLCENWHRAGERVREGVRDALGTEHAGLLDNFGAVETCVGKMTPRPTAAERAADPLAVGGEGFNRLVADADALVGTRPEVAGIDWVGHFPAWEERKLYIHNFGHAALAYLADRAGYEFLADAMADGAVAETVTRAMRATEEALARRYPEVFSPADTARHGADLRRRFANRALGDTAYRVGRDLARKFAPGDRLLGALRLVEETGGDGGPVRAVLLAALDFAARDEHGRPDAADQSYARRLRELGAADRFAHDPISALEILTAQATAVS